MSSPPAHLILAVNAGSSSLKISLFRRDSPSHSAAPSPAHPHDAVTLLLNASISNISAPPARFSFARADHDDPVTYGDDVKDASIDSITDHASAFAHFLDHLAVDPASITHVCHRVVHGGDYYAPVIISDESFHHIEALSDLAPLHNGAALSVIKACISQLPDAHSIAYFDTSFHRTIPAHVARYAIRPDIARARGLKKYGFHGLSYAYILSAVSSFLHKPPSETSLIVAHLGSGASLCAIAHGRSRDTSMGLTPVTGLPGATRAGGVDPALIFHYSARAGRMSHKNAHDGLHVTRAEQILNREGGWAALAGTTDFGEIVKRMKETPRDDSEHDQDDTYWDGPGRYALAFDMFVDRVAGFVGAYFVQLGGAVDALVFSGGIGERSAELREAVIARAACLGFALDGPKNDRASGELKGAEGGVVEITGSGGKRVLVCATDEQLEMAKECALEPKFWEFLDHKESS